MPDQNLVEIPGRPYRPLTPFLPGNIGGKAGVGGCKVPADRSIELASLYGVCDRGGTTWTYLF